MQPSTVMQPSTLRAVLFDWRGTLVHDPPHEWWVATALTRAGRAPDGETVAALCDALRRAALLPEVAAGEIGCDCSKAAHREWSMMFFERAGLDDELAENLYALDLDPVAHPFYPDTAPALRALHEQGCRVAVVSDIHVDLRPEFAAAGLDRYVDAYVLSYEQGMQKPDRAIFEIALRELEVGPEDALMVGDRASHDGGAVAAGITTLLLAPVASADTPVGLARVLAVVG
jgi:HAD superfamily hydrolase (TIGR01509 family)